MLFYYLRESIFLLILTIKFSGDIGLVGPPGPPGPPGKDFSDGMKNCKLNSHYFYSARVP